MKYPRLVSASTPSSLLVWLEEQLEVRGIDPVYTRYILSLLFPAPEPQECEEHASCPRISQFDYGDWRWPVKGRRKGWQHYQADLCSCTSTLQSKKSAALQCLKGATEQEFGLETLVEELCEKLENLKADLELFGKESLATTHFGPPTPPPSPKEHQQKYYAAFPSLNENSAPSQPPGNKDSPPVRMTDSSLVIPLLPFTKIKYLVKKKKAYLDHEPCALKSHRKNHGSLLKSPKSKRKKENQESPILRDVTKRLQVHLEPAEKELPLNGNGYETPPPNLGEGFPQQSDVELEDMLPLSPPASVTEEDKLEEPSSPWCPNIVEKEDLLEGKENVIPMSPPPIKYNLFAEGNPSLWPYKCSYEEDIQTMEQDEEATLHFEEPATQEAWSDSVQQEEEGGGIFTKINKPLASNSNWTFQSNGLYSSQYKVVQARMLESHRYINNLTSKPYMSSSLDERKLSPTIFNLQANQLEKLREEDTIDSSFYPLDPFPLLSTNYTFMDTSRLLRLEEESRVYHIWKPSSNSSSLETLASSSPLPMETSDEKSGRRYPLAHESPSGDSISSEGSGPFFDDATTYQHFSPDTQLEDEEDLEHSPPTAHRYKSGFIKTKSRHMFTEVAAKRPCTYFMEGSCLKPNCRFSHNLKTITCKFWLMNQCFKGDTCPFLHGFVPKKGSAATKNDKIQQRFTLESELDFPPLSVPSGPPQKEFQEGGTKASKKKQA